MGNGVLTCLCSGQFMEKLHLSCLSFFPWKIKCLLAEKQSGTIPILRLPAFRASFSGRVRICGAESQTSPFPILLQLETWLHWSNRLLLMPKHAAGSPTLSTVRASVQEKYPSKHFLKVGGQRRKSVNYDFKTTCPLRIQIISLQRGCLLLPF